MAYPKGGPHPKRVGDITTANVLARLVEAYGTVLVPFGENIRYDLVVEIDGRLVRVQCKTGRLRDGVIKFNACSSTYHHPGRDVTLPYNHHYRGQADLFGIYCPETRGVYLVPVAEIGKRMGSLRVDPTGNAQKRGIRWASDHELLPGNHPIALAHRRPGTSNGTLFESATRYAAC